MDRRIIAIVGFSGSGKDVASDVLAHHGFVSFRLSDAIRKYATENRIKITTTSDLVNLGNLLRIKEGPDILPRLIAQTSEFKHADRIVINGIRNPAEIDYLHEYHNAIIGGIIISEEKLLSNLLGRKRDGDPVDRDGFLRMLAREKGGDGANGMNIDECLKKVDFRIPNVGTKLDLENEISKYIHEMGLEIGDVGHEMHGHNHEHR